MINGQKQRVLNLQGAGKNRLLQLPQLGCSSDILNRNLGTVAHPTEDPIFHVVQPGGGIEFCDASSVHDADPIVTNNGLKSVCEEMDC